MQTPSRIAYLKKYRTDHKDEINAKARTWYKCNRTRPYYIKRRKSGSVGADSVDNYAGTSGIGREYEILASKLLHGSRLSESFHGPYDLIWKGLKIDVKMRNKNSKGSYIFSRKPTCTADYFLCFCVDGKKKQIILVPESIYRTSLTVTEHRLDTIYNKYKIDFKEQQSTERSIP